MQILSELTATEFKWPNRKILSFHMQIDERIQWRRQVKIVKIYFKEIL